jgi:YegS/Rv2252/BmrU family lipid kinase
MESSSTNNHPLRVKLIFNPTAGAADESPVQLIDVINQMQAWDLVPETFLIKPDCDDLLPIIQDALERGINMFVACGGDGTIECVCGALVDTHATLGIIPTGTRNNVALSLGIPKDIPTAVALLRTGQCIKIDVGLAFCGEISRLFLEACSVGLLSAIFPAADDIQHGNLGRIGDLLTTLVSAQAAEMHLIMDMQREIHTQGHVVLVANLPYVGPNFQIAPEGSFNDGLLDLIVFSDQSKLDLLSNVTQMAGGAPTDPSIQHFQVKRVDIDTDPLMAVMADGFSLGEGPLRISVQKHALKVMAGQPALKKKKNQDHPGNVEMPSSDSNVMIEV